MNRNNPRPTRRTALRVIATATASAASLGYLRVADAQSWPAKPVRVVVPAGAGGPADILGRLLGERLGRIWNQPVIVDNKPGASLMLGADAVAKSQPDGYTLLLTNDGPVTINPGLFPKMPYDPQKDLVAVAKVVYLPLVMLAHPSLPAKTVAEFIALAKSQPGKFNYGAGGSTTRMAAELFRSMTGTDIVYVPYKGSGPMVNGLMGNEVQVAFDGVATALGQVKAGRLIALGVTGTTRVPALPNVPTIAESGVAGYEAGTWIGVFGPAGTTKEVQDKVYGDLSTLLAAADVREQLAGLGMTPDLAPADRFAAQVRSDTEKWTRLIKRAGISAEN